jgi:hypothetical protein
METLPSEAHRQSRRKDDEQISVRPTKGTRPTKGPFLTN